MRSRYLPFALLASFLLTAAASAAEPLHLHLRERIPAAGKEAPLAERVAGKWMVRERAVDWDPKKTAIVICDMWDDHWCKCSARRVGEMAPRMNEVVTLARERGVFIIHCPSDTMEFYKDYPQRKLAQSAPAAEAKVPLQRRCGIDPLHEPPLPIDDTKGGCDDEPSPTTKIVWTRQHKDIEIKDGDAITDSPEAYHLLKQRGIENVIVMGVHTNMCVLARPFSVRQLSYQGLNVVLMRDMTDTMYDPDRAPQVSHAHGTDLVVGHIEKYWCPSITSSDFTGRPAFSFADDKRPHVVFVVGEDEYRTDVSLPQFAADELFPRGIRCTFVNADDEDKNRFPLMKAVETADLVFLSVRRRTPNKDELDALRSYVKNGKPIVAIRTSSHAFALREPKAMLAANTDIWPTFDVDVLGGKYEGHYGKAMTGPSALVWTNPEHPLSADVPIGELPSGSWLYKYTGLSADTDVMLWGRPAGSDEIQPAAWTRTKGRKVFYTMLGHPDDFQNETFRALMRRAVLWGLTK